MDNNARNELARCLKATTRNAELVPLSQISGTGRQVLHAADGKFRQLTFDRDMAMRTIPDEQGNLVWWAVDDVSGVQINISEWIRTDQIVGKGGLVMDAMHAVATELSRDELRATVDHVIEWRHPGGDRSSTRNTPSM